MNLISRRFESEGISPARRGIEHLLRCYGPGVGNSQASSAQSDTSTTTAGASSPVYATQGSSSPITITTTDAGAIAAAAQAVQAALTNASDTNQAVIQAATQAGTGSNDLLNTVLSAQSQLAANTQSGGQTDQNKTILYVFYS